MNGKEKIEKDYEIKLVKANSREYSVEANYKKQIKNLACDLIDHDIEFYIEEGTGDLLIITAENLERFIDIAGF